ncbi:putative phosphoesterase [Paenibacillus sp. DS2015]|uniref:metallophosphoesterase family protein n=1 Tax=Paenibacillus sp. DS2015 TaxID=3373917 RepID=UPI003D1E6BC6
MIGIISDIHGNYVALKKVLEAIDDMNINEIYCLGDVVGYYSQVNEVCDELRARNISCVMGNHDWYMVARSFCTRSESVNDCLQYQKKVISEVNLAWLSTFPFYRDIDNLRMVHGGWSNPIDEYLEFSDDYFNKVDGINFVSGHSHVQNIKYFGDKVYCNPGSVGQPRDGDPRAAFATWDGEYFQLHRVSYDIGAVGILMDAAGFNGYYYGCLRTGAKNLCY